ncbi:UxaA Altronate dehydratase [Rhabdaerophilaceae bacterium]
MTDPGPSLPRTLKLSAQDNVVVAVDVIDQGALAAGVRAGARVPRGHKIAVEPIAKGAPIMKYGQIIGYAGEDIAPGAHVHVHNCLFAATTLDYAFGEHAPQTSLVGAGEQKTFEGFRRDNGRFGTRNYVGILTSVNCSASAARFMAEEVRRSGLLDEFPNVDGVIALTHGTGCGIDYSGPAFEVLKRTTWGYACNPNMAAVLVVGLGCEGFQIARMKEAYDLKESDVFRTMTIQDTGGTRKTVASGVDALKTMLAVANRATRETAPASELMLALQCGGSDGYSGITANPALGRAVDLLVAQGGTAILSETPEIYGAEHLLTRRSVTPEVGRKIVKHITWWEDYTARNHQTMDNNPSPGNKAGGLTTILEKSLGAIAKAGSTAITDVYGYAERITARGLVYMDTPGFDPVSATGQVAGGANILAFTTGRGSAYGCKPTPSIKLATNSDIYRRMIDDMDINCGDVLDGTSLEAKGQEIFDCLLRVASGEPSKSETLGYGDAEFVPWQLGATM